MPGGKHEAGWAESVPLQDPFPGSKVQTWRPPGFGEGYMVLKCLQCPLRL